MDPRKIEPLIHPDWAEYAEEWETKEREAQKKAPHMTQCYTEVPKQNMSNNMKRHIYDIKDRLDKLEDKNFGHMDEHYEHVHNVERNNAVNE